VLVPGSKNFIFFQADYACRITAFAWLQLVCRSSEQEQIPIVILDDEILGAPRLPFQRLLKDNTSGPKLKKKQLDLRRRGDSHGCRQQLLPMVDRRLDYCSLDIP
jgi:hypothetical protein